MRDDQQSTDSPALALLRAAYAASNAPSDREMGYGMSCALSAALHLRLRFDLTDVATFVRTLGGREAFGAEGAEHVYGAAADLRHTTACLSFEAFFGRPAFIYDGKRLAVRDDVWMAGARRRLSVTSLGEHKGEAVLIGCSYTYESEVSHGTRRTRERVEKRVRLTREDVAAAEKARAGAVARENLVKAAAEGLDRWVDKGYRDPRTSSLIADWTDERLKEARKWCAANERAHWKHGGTEEALAAAPEFIRALVTGYAHAKRVEAARAEIQEALHKQNHKQGFAMDYTVSDDEIAARLRGDSIADILAKGTLVDCAECNGRAFLTCETCGSEHKIRCQACDGKGRVPPVTGKPDAADYDALCKTLGLKVQGGELTGSDGATAPTTGKPRKRQRLTEKQAMGLIVSEQAGAEHAAMQSPGVVGWVESRQNGAPTSPAEIQ